MKQERFTFADVDYPKAGATIQEQFEAFHRANPWVYFELKKLAISLRARGHSRIGIKMLFEVLRWQYYQTTDDPNGWKLNNNYTSRYARLLSENVPQLAGAFETRELKAS